ncbi:transcriptional regulator [Methylobacterium sp. J-030]|uniref:transcriptional regulator n=1 Tax=Methylobacterium sp. J-030 TaxID=2836627 RepID=UPI001FBAE425|nr:transcriptional regulator [Methylobacterium sp. J-030]MCJ2068567.1 transcriptional regulator [Methylobacterium sp. J-030]
MALAARIDPGWGGGVERGSENGTIATLEAMGQALAVRVADLLAAPPRGAARPQPLRAGRRPRAE